MEIFKLLIVLLHFSYEIVQVAGLFVNLFKYSASNKIDNIMFEIESYDYFFTFLLAFFLYLPSQTVSETNSTAGRWQDIFKTSSIYPLMRFITFGRWGRNNI